MPVRKKHQRDELHKFGLFMRMAREAKQISQEKAAELATGIFAQSESENTVSQSLIAQLEAGTNRNPDSYLLRVLAQAYDLSYEAVISELIKDKYGVKQVKSDRLKDDIKDIDELAQWEKEINPKELWIVAPNFIDDTHSTIAKSVLFLLKNGTQIKYFVSEPDSLSGGRFAIFKEGIITRIKKEHQIDVSDKITWCPLKQEHISWLATSFVIANPEQVLLYDDDSPIKGEGYYVIPEGSGKPSYGIAISQQELLRLVNTLSQVINKWSIKKISD